MKELLIMMLWTILVGPALLYMLFDFKSYDAGIIISFILLACFSGAYLIVKQWGGNEETI